MAGIYVHIPFCRHKCSYCDFTSFPDKIDYAEAYMACLYKELKMRGEVGNNGGFCLGISLLQRLDLVLLHVDRAEYEGATATDLLNVCGIEDNHLTECLGNGGAHLPTVSDRLLIGHACGARGCCEHRNLKIGVAVQERQKTLTDHTGRTDNTDFHLFHT